MSLKYLYYLGITSWVILYWGISPASCFEFSMRGAFVWDYVAYSQLGSRGFFGTYDIDTGTPGQGGSASANGWLGYRITSLTSSSTDAANSTMMMNVDPRIKISDAISIRGRYHIGTWGFSENVSDVRYPADLSPKHWDPVGNLTAGSWYSAMTIPGVGQPFSPGYWNMLWVTAQTPWGTMVVGKRPFIFGTGLMFNGEDNTSLETILIVLPMGPMRFGLGWYPWRRQIDQGYVQPTGISFQYFNPLDKSNGRRYDLNAFFTYDSGSLSSGIVAEAYSFNVGPEAVNSPTDKSKFLPQQMETVFGGAFFKYFDGVFFVNAEADWYYETVCLQPNMNGDLTPAFPPIVIQGALTYNPYLFRKSYIEHWRYMVESGTVVGPAKLSLIWSWIPGPDRRHGIIIDRQNSLYNDLLTNSGLFRPYSMILVNGYGTGANSVSTITSSGYLTDANAFGIRLDYAVAANLNLFAAGFHAQRISHGYGWGFIQPAIPHSTDATKNTGITTGFVEYIRKGTYDSPAPAIPDLNLGYEFDMGFDWKLLEGYTLTGNLGVFQPGNWFRFACIDRSNPGWKSPSPQNMFGINPDRNIDPVFAMDMTLTADF